MTDKKAARYFFMVLVFITAGLFFYPGHNGDLPFYIAAAVSRNGITDSTAIEETKSIIQNELDELEIPAHIDRIDHAEKNVLNYYRIKPLYISAIRFFHWLGFSYTRSTQIPSLIGYFLIGVLVFQWAIQIFSPGQTLVFSLILMTLNPCLVLARLSSPDGISNFLLFLVFYRIWFEKDPNKTAVLLVLSLFARPDNILAVGIILALMRVWPGRKIKTWLCVFYLIISLGSCLAINYFSEPEFWWFNRTNHQQVFLYLQSVRGWGTQLLTYFSNFSQSLAPVMILLGFVVYFRNNKTVSKRTSYLLTTILMIWVVRFILFPYTEERFLTAFYLCGFLVLLQELLKEGKSNNKPEFVEQFSSDIDGSSIHH